MPLSVVNDEAYVEGYDPDEGRVVAIVSKYLSNGIHNTKYISLEDWATKNQSECLFMGSSKLQLIPTPPKDEEEKANSGEHCYYYAMLYLEKLLLQRRYEQRHYNAMKDRLYAKDTLDAAWSLIEMRNNKSNASPTYIDTLFNHWCDRRDFITFEGFGSEMNTKIKQFFYNSVTDDVNRENLKQLFPNLKQYIDANGVLHDMAKHTSNTSVRRAPTNYKQASPMTQLSDKQMKEWNKSIEPLNRLHFISKHLQPTYDMKQFLTTINYTTERLVDDIECIMNQKEQPSQCQLDKKCVHFRRLFEENKLRSHQKHTQLGFIYCS
eukprot:360883_1